MTGKERLLMIREIFHTETDEDHQLSYDDMLERLQELNGPMAINMKAIKDDINTLIKVRPHLNVNIEKYGKKMFSFQERLFEIYELRLLMDAVSASKFITKKQRDNIISKIKSLTSIHEAERLVSQIYLDDIVVSVDDRFRITIDRLHIDVQQNNDKLRVLKDPVFATDYKLRLVYFKYGRYDLNKKFIVNSKLYKAVPLALVMNNGFYYLIAFDLYKEEFINFRVDRMRNVKTDESLLSKEIVKKLLEFSSKEYLNSCFNMYPGEKSKIKIRFDSHLINAIIDRFGKDVDIQLDQDERSFVLNANAAINTGLVRWILNWGSDALVLEPESLKEMIKDEIDKMFSIYHK